MTKVTVGLAAGLLLAAAPAWADVTITSTQSGKMAGGDGVENIQRIKGGKMRTDVTRGNDRTSIIMDVDAGKMITIDHKKKEATEVPVATVAEAVQKIGETDVQASLKPTGETKQVLGYTCAVHQSDVTVNFAQAEGLAIKILMNGPVCLSKDAPGRADYAKFYTTAVEKGFIFGDPRAAKAQPGPAKGIARLHKAWAEAGVPLTAETTLKFDGGGMLTGMMNRMVGGPTTLQVSKIDTAPIDDAEFTVPAGYKVKTQ